MLRVCNGQDPNLIDASGQPDACGLAFDDIERSVIHPHVFIPTQAEKARLLELWAEIYVEPVS